MHIHTHIDGTGTQAKQTHSSLSGGARGQTGRLGQRRAATRKMTVHSLRFVGNNRRICICARMCWRCYYVTASGNGRGKCLRTRARLYDVAHALVCVCVISARNNCCAIFHMVILFMIQCAPRAIRTYVTRAANDLHFNYTAKRRSVGWVFRRVCACVCACV